MESMKALRNIVLATLLVLPLTGCANHYRYTCQDPANWNEESCNPPTCLGYGECVNDIYGYDPREVTTK